MPLDRIRQAIDSRRRRLSQPRSLSISDYVASFPAAWQVTHPPVPLAWPPPRRIGRQRLRVELDLPQESSEFGILSIEDGRVFGVHGWVIGVNGAVLPELSWYGRPDERISLPSSLPTACRLGGTCLSLVSDWSCRNYAHFLLDALGRLAVFEAGGGALSDVDHFYCPTPPGPGAAAVFDRMGIPPERRVFAARGLLVSAERLLIPSRPATARTYPAWLPAFFHRVVRAEPSVADGRRLYVSRRGFTRQSREEPELERALCARDFEVYEPSERRTQPEDFHEATFIVGAHGAGLANLAFCQPGTRVLEIVPTDNAYPHYYSLAVGAGLDYAYIVAQSAVDRPPGAFGPSPYDFELEVDELAAAVDRWDEATQMPARP